MTVVQRFVRLKRGVLKSAARKMSSMVSAMSYEPVHPTPTPQPTTAPPTTSPPHTQPYRHSPTAADKLEAEQTLNTQKGIGNYEFVRRLGSGTYGVVKLARHTRTGHEVAVKIINKTALNDRQLSKLNREVRIMKKLSHPHIVKLYEVLETHTIMYLIMEYCAGGELYDYLIAHGRMKETTARNKFMQIFSALHYCHTNRVIHRDLKAENLLLDEHCNIKIADFGLGNFYDPDGVLDTFCGSPQYAAPELFLGKKYTGPEVDVWAIGIILYVMATSCLPFSGRDFGEMKAVVCNGRFMIADHVSKELQQLLRRLIVADPSKRTSLNLFMDDPWLNAEGDFRTQLRDIYDFEQLVGPTDHTVMPPIERSIVEKMIKKYHYDEKAIMQSLRDNEFDEITTVYRLLWGEQRLKELDASIPMIEAPTITVIPVDDMDASEPAPLGHRRTSSEQTLNSTPAAVVVSPDGSVVPHLPPQGDDPELVTVPVAPAARAPHRTMSVVAEESASDVSPPASPAPVETVNDDDADQDEPVDVLSIPFDSENYVPGAPRPSRGKPRMTRRRSSSMSELPTSEALRLFRMRKAAAGNLPPVPQGKAQNVRSMLSVQPETPKSARQRIVLPPNMIAMTSSSPRESITPPPFGFVPHSRESSFSVATDPEASPRASRKSSDRLFFSERTSMQTPPPGGISPASSPTPPLSALARPLSFLGSLTHKRNRSNDERTLTQAVHGTASPVNKPRVLRFTFSSTTTSARPPEDIQEQVVTTCVALNLHFDVTAPFLVTIDENCKMEVEVCLLPRLRNLHGVRFKRLSGSSAEYKELCEKILDSLMLD